LTSWTAQQSHGKPYLTYLLIALLILAPLQAEAAETTPAQQPQQQNNRSSGNAAAIAAAAAAAGIAAASCMKLYEAAKQARAAGDIAGAEKLESQAAMQCAQAAQNAANAGQNQGGQDQITAANMAPGEQNTAQTTPTTTPTETGPTAPLTEETTTPTAEEQVVAENSQAVAPTTFEQPNSEVTGGPGATGGMSAAQTTLPQIPREGITYDDTAGNPSANGFAASSAGGSNGFGTPGGGLASNSLFDSVGGSKAAEELQALAHGNIGRGKGKSGEGAGADSSGGSEGERGSTFGSMLSSLMGGPAADQIATTAGAGGAAGFGADGKAAGKAPNIFEYANYRFRKLNREGEVRVAVKVERKLASTKK
jgi:hypothetical protein